MKTSPFKVLIPARYKSQRLPGKPLIDLQGRPMLEHVWRTARASSAVQTVIATDDRRIQTAATAFGAEVVMTQEDHVSGTDRIAEAARLLGWDSNDIIVNLQADEPLMPSALIDQVAMLLQNKPDLMMATLCEALDDPAVLTDPNQVKVVCNQAGEALYFSRAPIPWQRDKEQDPDTEARAKRHFYRHLGIYAYRMALLQQITTWSTGELEAIEQLEQLRVLAKGFKIGVAVASEACPESVDTPADLEKIRLLLQKIRS